VQGFPTLKIVKPGKTPGKPIVEDYQGPRTAKGIYEAVSDKIPNLVTKVEDKNLEKWLEDSSKKTKAILFTDKGRTSALLKAVAVDFKGSIEIAQIRNTAKASGELFGISEYPTLLLLPGGKEATEGIPFNGELTKENIVEFLSQAASPNPDPAPPKAKISKLKNAKKEDKSKADFESASSAHAKADASDAAASATDETMEEEATESPEPIVETEKPIVLPPAPQLEILESETQLIAECMGSRTGTCILALLPSSPDETATQAIVSLSEVAHNHHTQQRALFPFYIVPETNPAYAQIQTSLSLTGFEVIAINGKRGWWRPLPQDVTAESIETWVDSIRLGEGTKQKIPAGLIPEELEAEPTIVEDGPEVAEETVIVEPVEEETVQSAEAHDEL
jgi:protein disulfide-isomerase A6